MSRKILVVDDSEVALQVIKDDLEEGGFEVLTAESAGEALELLGEGEMPDAILVDLEMPEMSGAAFCKKIRAQENTQHIPVYLVTIKKRNRGCGYYQGKRSNRLPVEGASIFHGAFSSVG